MSDRPPFPFLPHVLSGETTDSYFLRARETLAHLHADPRVGIEIFPRASGVFCGVSQVIQLLESTDFEGEMWSLQEGDAVAEYEAAVQIFGRYSGFGIYETAILGILASSTGWATSAAEVVSAAGVIPAISFGARHVHPNVAAIMDYCAIVGGCASASTPLGAALAGKEPSGTMPHALILIAGDTLTAAAAFDEVEGPQIPRIVLVDTLQDEGVESLRVADALGKRLQGVRLDTPSERGGVSPAMVREIRARLDQAGHETVGIFVSGGLTPSRIRSFTEEEAPVDGFGVGSYISGSSPNDYTADIREIDGKPIAKRGRVPGMSRSERLRRML